MILNPELNPCDGFGVRIGAPPRESEREGERELGGGYSYSKLPVRDYCGRIEAAEKKAASKIEL